MYSLFNLLENTEVKAPRSSSWQVAELLSWQRARKTVKELSWSACFTAWFTKLNILCWHERTLHCHAHSCAATVVKLRLKWHKWDLQGPWLMRTQTSPEHVLFSTGYGFRKGHAVGCYLEYNLLQKCRGFFFSCVRCHLDVNKTAVCFPHVWCFLQQTAVFCILAPQWMCGCRNFLRAREK